MEQTNVQVVAKKLWNLVRVMYYMLRKGISKGKLIFNLNAMLKRGKIAGKSAILNLMLHHHHSTNPNHQSHDGHLSYRAPREEYEFNCSNSPSTMSFPFHLGKHNKHYSGACDNNDHAPEVEDDVIVMANAVKKVLEMPGFGVVRVTDSPSPIGEVGGNVDNGHVDEAAEDFIVRFYNDLKKQNQKAFTLKKELIKLVAWGSG